MPLTNQQISFVLIWLVTLLLNVIFAGIMGSFSNVKRVRNYLLLVVLGVFVIFGILLFLYDLNIISDLVLRVFEVS